MWSTPADMARFAIELMLAYEGKSDRVLSQETAVQMLTPQPNGGGLGIGVGDDGSDRFYFFHDGANDGYKSVLVGYPERGQGLVIMTNSDSGDALWQEILNSVSIEYGWLPNYTNLVIAIIVGLVLAAVSFLVSQQKRRRLLSFE